MLSINFVDDIMSKFLHLPKGLNYNSSLVLGQRCLRGMGRDFVWGASLLRLLELPARRGHGQRRRGLDQGGRWRRLPKTVN